jgi:Flp pilus assembly protein TadD
LQARALIGDPVDEARIERSLAEIANRREQPKEALSHYQRVAELAPDESEAWADVALAHQGLGNFEEAEANYRQAIAVEPREAYYFKLSELYKTNDQFDKAIDVLKEGLTVNPESAVLHAYAAMTYLNNDDYDQAEAYLNKAAEIEPDLDVLPVYRSLLALRRLEQMQEPTSYKPGKPVKRKKRGR